MKKPTILQKVYILALVSFASCAPQTELLKPTGDMATIVMRNQTKLVGELLAVSDSTVHFKIESGSPTAQASPQEKIIGVRVDDLQTITIAGYSNKNWVAPVLLFEAVPAALLAAAASSADADAGSVLLVFSIPPALNLIAFAATTPAPPRFKHPFTSEQLEGLKKYARFPQGLTLVQLEQLLVANQQSKIRQFE